MQIWRKKRREKNGGGVNFNSLLTLVSDMLERVACSWQTFYCTFKPAIFTLQRYKRSESNWVCFLAHQLELRPAQFVPAGLRCPLKPRRSLSLPSSSSARRCRSFLFPSFTLRIYELFWRVMYEAAGFWHAALVFTPGVTSNPTFPLTENSLLSCILLSVQLQILEDKLLGIIPSPCSFPSWCHLSRISHFLSRRFAVYFT